MTDRQLTSEKKLTRHAPSPIVDAYSLCHVTHEEDKPVKFAKPGERVNCPSCRTVINFCKTVGRTYVMPQPEEPPSFSPNWDERHGYR